MAEKATKPLFNAGDRVRVRKRDVTPSDVKSRLYYDHFAGVTGTVRRSYESSEVWVDVDIDSLPKVVQDRHRETEAQMKRRWLDGLSEEARRRLTDREREFKLRYSILVAPEDLLKEGARPKSAHSEAADKRRTEKDLAASESAYLAERKKAR